jgi:hypothetical protein
VLWIRDVVSADETLFLPPSACSTFQAWSILPLTGFEVGGCGVDPFGDAGTIANRATGTPITASD